MTLTQVLSSSLLEAAKIAGRWSLSSEVAFRYALLDQILRCCFNGKAPRIISGHRSARRQAALKKAYDLGHSVVLDGETINPPAYPPARYSMHTTGYAIDVQQDSTDPESLRLFRRAWTLMPYGRDGASFNPPDKSHFDVEVPILSKPKASW